MISSVKRSDNKLYFHELPTDVLLHIFQFSDLKTLLSLSCCCKRFHGIISDDSVWTGRSKVAVVTNQSSKDIIKRSSKYLRAKQKCRISVNWKLGSYVEKCFSTRVRFMPKLLLEKSRLWMSQGANIYGFKRQDSLVQWKNPQVVLSNRHSKDVCNFVKLDSLLLSGGRDGKVCGWSEITGELLFERNCHDLAELRCISASRDIFVTGSKDSFLKVWKLNENECCDTPVSTFSVDDSPWSLAVDPVTKHVCCGTAGLSCSEAINLFDLESGIKTSYSVRKGSAIFDIKWESSSTFLTCGFDSILRLWDTRTKECVMSWMDPFDAAGYCIASDNCNSVLCGTALNSRVQLWDMRMKLSVQSFFCKSSSSSPVYSVTFDPCSMFAALDLSLNVLDFSGNLKTRNDYRSAWGG